MRRWHPRLNSRDVLWGLPHQDIDHQRRPPLRSISPPSLDQAWMRPGVLMRPIDPTMTLPAAAGGVFAPTITKVHRAVLQRHATCRDPVSHLFSMCQFLELVFEEIGRFLSQTSPTFWMDQAEYGCEASKVQIFANRADRCGRKEGGRNG